MRLKEKLLLALSLTLALGATPALAHQPSDVVRVAETISVEGPSKQVTGSFTLQNQGAIPLSVQIPPLRTGAFEFRYSPDKLILAPGKQAEVRFTGAFYKDGKWQVAPRVEYYTTNGKPVGHLYVDSYFLVRQGKFFRSSYAELFLKRDLRDRQLGPLFRAARTSPNMPRAPGYKNKRSSPKETLKRAKELPSLKASLPPVVGPAQFLAARYDHAPSPKRFHGASGPQRTVRLRGNFTWFGADGLLHPAYFWTVSAYTGRDGDWRLAGSDPVQGDGNWEFTIPYSGGPIRIVYGAESTYLIPVDESNDRYQWAHDIESVTDTVEVGSYSADGPPGLGEIYSEAMSMLTALIWNAEVNPLHRDTSIKVIFPNTRFDCGRDDGVPWACHRGATIWMTSGFALQSGTIIHELGHDLHDLYWWDDLPGGKHSLTGCSSAWLALSEGFADFMPDWVLSDRAAINPAAFGFSIENPSTACMSPLATNESWVAATLWDLHDSNNDGADTTMFSGRGDVVRIFLEALGPARERPDLSRRIRSMVGLGITYKRQARSLDGAPSEASIDDILRQDFIIP